MLYYEVITMSEKKRVTLHSGRKNRNGKRYSSKHNDRNFDVNKNTASHIDATLKFKNVYYDFTDLEHDHKLKRLLKLKDDNSFDTNEHAYYNIIFYDALEAQNKRHKAKRNYARIKTMDQYYEANPPFEDLFQIGTNENFVGGELLDKIFQEQLLWESKTFPNVHILNAAKHCDEKDCAEHYHIRKLFIGHDKEGNAVASKTKALEEMAAAGILKKPEGVQHRWNNLGQVYTAMCRKHLEDLCKKYGIELDLNRKDKSKVGLSLEQYKANKEQEKAEKLNKENEKITKEIIQKEEELNKLNAEINTVTDKINNINAELKVIEDIADRHNKFNELKIIIKKTEITNFLSGGTGYYKIHGETLNNLYNLCDVALSDDNNIIKLKKYNDTLKQKVNDYKNKINKKDEKIQELEKKYHDMENWKDDIWQKWNNVYTEINDKLIEKIGINIEQLEILSEKKLDSIKKVIAGRNNGAFKYINITKKK